MKRQLTSLGNGVLIGANLKKRIACLGGGMLLVAAFGSVACTEDAAPEPQDTIGEDNELGVNFDALGVNLPTCTAAATTGGSIAFVAGTKTLELAVTSGADAVISVAAGKLKVNGYQCRTAAIAADPGATPPVAAVAAVDLTSTNVNKINIAADNTNKIVIDLLPGTFGNIFGTAGGVVLTGDAAVGIRGSAAANVVKMGEETATAYYFELSGDTKPDLKIAGNPSTVTLALGDGADSFTGQGQVLTTTSLGGSAVTGDVTNQAVLVYGGVGNDSLKGGLGADTLDGGDGSDLFQTSAGSVSDGADVYVGGAGTDTVDYSARTDAVAVSVAPTYTSGWAEGVNLFNFSVSNAETLEFTHGATAVTFAFTAAKTGAVAILADLNAGAPGTLGPVATASINNRGELVIVKDGTVGAFAVTGGDAGLFGGATTSNDGVAQLASDPDDGIQGLTPELDDVRGDVENITGGTGNDTLTGGAGHDTINGGAGNDDIAGGIGGGTCADDVDVLNGGDGDDVFAMGVTTNCGDAIDGGSGKDIADYQMRTAALTITVDATANDGEASEADKVLATVEVLLGGSVADVITGGTGDDDIHGGPGADSLIGGTGNDSLSGGPGVDTLLGGLGDDYFNETDAIDQYKNTAGVLVDAFIKQHQGSTIGTAEADLINGGADFDTCDYGRTVTTAMTVTLCLNATVVNASGACVGGGTDTADTDDITNCDDFVAGAGADTITGSEGDDMINGGTGNDLINGGLGNDQLIGGGGTDTLNGGTGEDICGIASVTTGCEI
jgi:Ca2+-binding RTX toxin-like protein